MIKLEQNLCMVRLNMIPEVRLDFESKKMKVGDV